MTGNVGMTKESVLKTMGTFGKQFGQGMQSRPNAAQIAVEAANKGVFDATTDHAKEIYGAFAAEAAKTKGVEFKAVASFDVQVSKMKQFLTLGGLPEIDGVVVFANTYDAITGLAQRAENPLKSSAYDLLCKVARRQIASPKAQLTPSEIEDILLETPADKGDVEKVIDAYKRVASLKLKLEEGGVNVSDLADALTMMEAQIKAMGGEVPPVTEQQKEIAKATKLLAKNGLAVTFVSANDTDEGEQPAAEQRLIDSDRIAAE